MNSRACQREIEFIRAEFRSGNAAEAFELATYAAQRWPNVPDFPKYAGLSAAALGCHDTACAEFERAWLLAPMHTSYALRFGMSLLHNARANDALSMLETVSRKTSLEPPLLHLQALAYVRTGRQHAALRSLLQSLSIRPGHLGSVALVIDICQTLGKQDIALKAAERLCELTPECKISQARMNAMKGG